MNEITADALCVNNEDRPTRTGADERAITNDETWDATENEVDRFKVASEEGIVVVKRTDATDTISAIVKCTGMVEKPDDRSIDAENAVVMS